MADDKDMKKHASIRWYLVKGTSWHVHPFNAQISMQSAKTTYCVQNQKPKKKKSTQNYQTPAVQFSGFSSHLLNILLTSSWALIDRTQHGDQNLQRGRKSNHLLFAKVQTFLVYH